MQCCCPRPMPMCMQSMPMCAPMCCSRTGGGGGICGGGGSGGCTGGVQYVCLPSFFLQYEFFKGSKNALFGVTKRLIAKIHP